MELQEGGAFAVVCEVRLPSFKISKPGSKVAATRKTKRAKGGFGNFRVVRC